MMSKPARNSRPLNSSVLTPRSRSGTRMFSLIGKPLTAASERAVGDIIVRSVGAGARQDRRRSRRRSTSRRGRTRPGRRGRARRHRRVTGASPSVRNLPKPRARSSLLTPASTKSPGRLSISLTISTLGRTMPARIATASTARSTRSTAAASGSSGSTARIATAPDGSGEIAARSSSELIPASARPGIGQPARRRIDLGPQFVGRLERAIDAMALRHRDADVVVACRQQAARQFDVEAAGIARRRDRGLCDRDVVDADRQVRHLGHHRDRVGIGQPDARARLRLRGGDVHHPGLGAGLALEPQLPRVGAEAVDRLAVLANRGGATSRGEASPDRRRAGRDGEGEQPDPKPHFRPSHFDAATATAGGGFGGALDYRQRRQRRRGGQGGGAASRAKVHQRQVQTARGASDAPLEEGVDAPPDAARLAPALAELSDFRGVAVHQVGDRLVVAALPVARS